MALTPGLTQTVEQQRSDCKEFVKVNTDGLGAKRVLLTGYDGSNFNDISIGTDGKIASSDESNVLLRRIVKLLESNAVVDIQGKQKINVESANSFPFGTVLGSSSTTTPIPTVNAPTNLAPIQQASQFSWIPVWIGPIDQRFVMIDQSRNTYANGIRRSLVWS